MNTQTLADFPYTDSPPRVACPKCRAPADSFCLTPTGRRLATLFHDARYVAARAADRTPPELRPMRVEDAATLSRVREEVFGSLQRHLPHVTCDCGASAVPGWQCGPRCATRRPTTGRDLDLVAVLGRTDARLEDFARVADQVLAWDSASFVNLCGVEVSDVRAADITPAGLAALSRINGRPFAYDLHTWST